MEAPFDPELQAKLYDAWFREKIKSGLDQLDNGEFLTHDEVGVRLKGLMQINRDSVERLPPGK